MIAINLIGDEAIRFRRARNKKKYDAWKLRNPDRYKSYARRWRAEHPEYQAQWKECLRLGLKLPKRIVSEEQKKRNEESRLRSFLRKTYSLTIEQYRAMLDRQGNACASCAVPESSLPRRLYVDHDHRTGRVRGLLCQNCNTALGHAFDSVDRLQKLIKYLTRFGE